MATSRPSCITSADVLVTYLLEGLKYIGATPVDNLRRCIYPEFQDVSDSEILTTIRLYQITQMKDKMSREMVYTILDKFRTFPLNANILKKFRNVLWRGLFSEGVNWESILMVIIIARSLIVNAYDNDEPHRIIAILDEMIFFFDDSLLNCVIERGKGWEALAGNTTLEYFMPPRNQLVDRVISSQFPGHRDKLSSAKPKVSQQKPIRPLPPTPLPEILRFSYGFATRPSASSPYSPTSTQQTTPARFHAIPNQSQQQQKQQSSFSNNGLRKPTQNCFAGLARPAANQPTSLPHSPNSKVVAQTKKFKQSCSASTAKPEDHQRTKHCPALHGINTRQKINTEQYKQTSGPIQSKSAVRAAFVKQVESSKPKPQCPPPLLRNFTPSRPTYASLFKQNWAQQTNNQTIQTAQNPLKQQRVRFQSPSSLFPATTSSCDFTKNFTAGQQNFEKKYHDTQQFSINEQTSRVTKTQQTPRSQSSPPKVESYQPNSFSHSQDFSNGRLPASPERQRRPCHPHQRTASQSPRRQHH